MKKHRIPNPYNAITGSPEVPMMCVNSVDELGRISVRVMRSATGQLYTVDKDGITKRLDESKFYKTVHYWHYGKKELKI